MFCPYALEPFVVDAGQIFPIAHHIVVVAFVIDVDVFREDVDPFQADVHLDIRLPDPPEVVLLFAGGRGVEYRLQVTSVVKVFHEYVAGPVETKPYVKVLER